MFARTILALVSYVVMILVWPVEQHGRLVSPGT